MPIRLRPAITLQLAKGRHRTHGQFDALDRVARLAAQTRSLRGRDLSQIIGAFEQQNVFAARVSQRIRNATSDSTAADDHKLGSTWQSRIHVWLFEWKFPITI